MTDSQFFFILVAIFAAPKLSNKFTNIASIASLAIGIILMIIGVMK